MCTAVLLNHLHFTSRISGYVTDPSDSALLIKLLLRSIEKYRVGNGGMWLVYRLIIMVLLLYRGMRGIFYRVSAISLLQWIKYLDSTGQSVSIPGEHNSSCWVVIN